MLPFAKQASQRLSRRAATMLLLLGGFTFAAPTLYLSFSRASPAAPVAASDPDHAEGPPPAAAAKVPAAIANPQPALPPTILSVPGRPNEFRRPLALAEVTTAPLRLLGSLTLDPNRLARVHAQFAGEVMAIGKIREKHAGAAQDRPERDLRQGDRVTKGQVLAVVWSKELGEKKSDLIDALLRRWIEQPRLARLEDLARGGSISESQLREAKQRVELHEIEVGKAERTLRSWRVTEEEIDDIRREVEKLHKQGERVPKNDAAWAQFEVRAPLEGVVLEKNAVPGDVVDSKFDLFKIADLSKLGVVASVPEKDVQALKALPPERRRWSIHLTSEPRRPPIVDNFDVIGDVIDPSSNTAVVRGSVNNADGALRAGQMITAWIIVDLPEHGLAAVPSAALVVDEGGAAKLYVETHAQRHEFAWQPVITVDQSAEIAIVRTVAAKTDEQTLRVGTRVVVWGPPETSPPGASRTPPAALPVTLPVTLPAAEAPADEGTPLSEAVAAFNAKAAADPIGKDQPPLTEDEVVAAILWSDLIKTEKATDKEYRAFQQIAERRRLPKGSEFEVLTGFQPNEGIEFQAWSVRIRMPRQVDGMPGGSYAFTIRDRRIASRPIGAEERKVMKKWAREPHGIGFGDAPYNREREKAREIDEAHGK